MTHIIAGLFFMGLLLGLAVLLQFTIAGSWKEIMAALRYQPGPQPAGPSAIKVSVQKQRHAAL